VDIEAGIDPDTGVIRWTIACADPATGFWPEDIFAGFLPPNQESIFYPDPADPTRTIHPGEGYVSYSVKPKPGLATGTQIKNKASIVFDWNEAIDTPEVLNTIDAVAPSSSVNPLPAQMYCTAFPVSWAGQDDAGGSGVEGYTVYVSDNGGAYAPWLTTEETTATFTAGEAGHTYRFYSAARDHVGNTEPPPTDAAGAIVPDATTLVTGLNVGDFDCDTDVDLGDFLLFQDCFNGPNRVPKKDGCANADFDADADVDVADFLEFQDCFNGPNRPPKCGA